MINGFQLAIVQVRMEANGKFMILASRESASLEATALACGIPALLKRLITYNRGSE